MAQRVQVILEDDLDGGEASETVRFSLDGVAYEIDLNEQNARRLRDDLAPWTGHARRTGRGQAKATSPRTKSPRIDAGDIRAWAQENGMKVSARGRVPAEVREAYQRAHG